MDGLGSRLRGNDECFSLVLDNYIFSVFSVFSVAIFLCAFAPLRLCAFAPLRLCASFRQPTKNPALPGFLF
jgi:hypothetical protein